MNELSRNSNVLKHVTVILGWVSPEYERKLHKRGLCTGDKCPLRMFPAPRPPRES